MPKVLICASTISHIIHFHLPYLVFFKAQGYEVHIATPALECLGAADCNHTIPMAKRFFSLKNISAIEKLRRIVRENDFDLILTHTALSGAVGRAAVLLAGKGKTKVIHTVHGYLFWNGCGFVKKVVYYTPEWLLRGVTDCIITMNCEDTITARKLVRTGGLVEKVPGMGVDAYRFIPACEEEKRLARQELSIPEDTFVLVYAAEFSERKNHLKLIRAMEEIVKRAPDTLLLLCGIGALLGEAKAETERLKLCGKIRFLGWCDHMEKIYRACDLAVSSSISEGLPFNIVEAQLCLLPVVASDIRGHTDLIEDGENGWLYPPDDYGALVEAVLNVIRRPDHGKKQGEAAGASALKYTLTPAYTSNTTVYKKMMQTGN